MSAKLRKAKCVVAYLSLSLGVVYLYLKVFESLCVDTVESGVECSRNVCDEERCVV